MSGHLIGALFVFSVTGGWPVAMIVDWLLHRERNR